MNKEKLNGAAKTLLMPIDWGLGFALAHKWSLLTLALLPTCLELVASYAMYHHRLLRQEAMIMFVLTSIANVWLFIASVMLVIESVKGTEISLWRMGLRAFVLLPKVLISYFLTLFFILLGLRAFVVPGLVFIGFLIWAPAFCAGEAYTKRTKKKDQDDVDPEAAAAAASLKPVPFFTDRPVWDLGLVRSWRVAGPTFFSSFQLALLFLASFVVPMALVDLFGDATLGYSAQGAKVILTSFLGAIVKGIWAGTFIMIIPPDARLELGIDSYPDLQKVCAQKSITNLRYEGRLGPQFGVLFVCAVSTWIVVQQTIAQTDMPSNVTTELTKIEADDDELVVTLRMFDPSQEYRWFAPERFRLEFESSESKVPSVPEAPAPSTAEPADPVAALLSSATAPSADSREFLGPSTIVVFDKDGVIMPLDSLSPYDGPIKIILRFEMQRKGDIKRPFSIFYYSFSGPGRALISGELDSTWS